MQIKNEAMLITYADSLGRNLQELNEILDKHLKGVVGGVHLLPFYPSSGDRGFAPMDYTQVDESFGSWSEVEEMSRKFYMMYDFMINHISRQSPYFQDFLDKKRIRIMLICSSGIRTSGRAANPQMRMSI